MLKGGNILKPKHHFTCLPGGLIFSDKLKFYNLSFLRSTIQDVLKKFKKAKKNFQNYLTLHNNI